MSYRVPHLDAVWADTVNLSTLDPRLLVAARARLGMASSQLLQRRLLPIPIEYLAGHRLVRYSGATRWINSSPGQDVPTEPPAHEFEPTDPQAYRETTDVPAAHLEYLTECQAAAKRALGFVHVPHVLALGPSTFPTSTRWTSADSVQPVWVLTKGQATGIFPTR